MSAPESRPNLINGWPAIGAHLGITASEARIRAENGEIPTFRMGDGKAVYARRSELDAATARAGRAQAKAAAACVAKAKAVAEKRPSAPPRPVTVIDPASPLMLDANAPDLLAGYAAIGAHLGISARVAKKRAEAGEIPTFRQGDGTTVYARRSLLDAVTAAVAAAQTAWKASLGTAQADALAAVPRRSRGNGSLSRRKWLYKGKARYAWSVRWKDEGGHYRGRQFNDRKQAEELLARVRLTNGSPYVPLPEEVTVRYASGQFLKWADQRQRDGRIGATHLRGLERVVRLHIIDRIGHLGLAQLKLDQLTRWHRTLMAERALSPSVARDSVRTLKAIFEYAIRREWVVRNPVGDLLIELRGIPARSIRTPSLGEIRALFSALERSDVLPSERSRQLARCFSHIAGFCGLRFGEIAALDRDHVDFAAGVIKVRRNLTALGEIKGPKSKAGNRDIRMPDHIRQLVSSWIAHHWVENDKELIFTATTGKPIGNSNFHAYVWKPLLIAAGLSDGESIHFHALRHFAASWMIKNGWPITEVSAMLGHSRVNMTLDVYAHALTDLEARRSATQAISDLIVTSASPRGVPLLAVAARAPTPIIVGA